MKYVLLLDPDDSFYAVWMRNSLGWHHLGQGWGSTKEQVLRRFCNSYSYAKPQHVQSHSRLLQRIQIITEFTVNSHPEYFL